MNQDDIWYLALMILLYGAAGWVGLRILFAVFPAARDWPFNR